jgi:hypothetical protein
MKGDFTEVWHRMTSDPANYKFFFDLRRDVDALRSEVKEIREFLCAFDKDAKILAQDTTDRIKYFYEAITVLRDTVEPIEEHLFPGVRDAREHLARIVIEGQQHDKPEEPPPA